MIQEKLHSNMAIVLIPIRRSLEENKTFLDNPECTEILETSVTYYSNIGYYPPWIGYFASLHGKLVGTGGFKGRPMNGKVEVAYGTFPPSQGMGIGTAICRELVLLAKRTDSSVRVIARTLQEESYSTRILQKNGFRWQGIVDDDDDGDVWEWEYDAAP